MHPPETGSGLCLRRAGSRLVAMVAGVMVLAGLSWLVFSRQGGELEVSWPRDVTSAADADCHAAVPDLCPGVLAVGARGGFAVTQRPKPGTVVDRGVHEVVLIAKDGQGRQESFNPPMVADAQPTRIIPDTAARTVELVLSSPVRSNPTKSFLASVTLKIRAGEAADFK